MKELTKKQMKEYMKGLVDSKWERVHNIKWCIEKYNEKTEHTELETRCYEIDVNTKHQLVLEICELEKLYKTFFGKDINEERY